MNIIELAREAGLKVGTNISGVTLFGSPAEIGLAHIDIDEMEAFANLVRAQALEEAAAVCDEAAMFHEAAAGSELAGELAAAIRALKEQP